MKAFLFAVLVGLLTVYNVSAQSLSAISEKIGSTHNFTYTDILTVQLSFQDEASIDTLRTQIAVRPAEKQIGGFYKIGSKNSVELFDGDKYIALNLRDSTYRLDTKGNQGQSTRSVLYWGKQFADYLKKPGQITQLADTVINNRTCVNFLIKRKDTIDNGKHLYWQIKIVADKKTLLPSGICERMYDHTDDGALLGWTEQHIFSNYELNTNNFPDLSNAMVPVNFKLPVTERLLPMLTAGTAAPKLELKSLEGQNFNIDDLKGKIVLLNFTTIGCSHCANAAQMLSRLSEKYGKNQVAIVSIYQSNYNDQKSIAKFDTRFNVKYPSYLTHQDAHKDYHIQGYPNFYLLNRQGVIIKSFDGFYASLEKEMTDQIEAIK